MPRGMHNRALVGIAGQEVSEAWGALEPEHLVQRAAARVTIHDERTVAGIGERHREVRRDERLAIAWRRARDGECHLWPARVLHVHAQSSERLNELRNLLRRLLSIGLEEFRHRTTDRQTELLDRL